MNKKEILDLLEKIYEEKQKGISNDDESLKKDGFDRTLIKQAINRGLINFSGVDYYLEDKGYNVLNQGRIAKNTEQLTEIMNEISDNIKTEKQGIIVKADSLGSLEALLLILGQNNIPVVKAGIGMISKTDLISAKANLEINELDAIIIGFNSELDSEAKELEKKEKGIKILTDKVIYKLIEDLVEFREEKMKEIEKERLLANPSASTCKEHMN